MLDTGATLDHPTWLARRVVTSSFSNGETVDDGNGHGTHCNGTARGPRRPAGRPGYGIACDADIYAGKVLSNAGSGIDGRNPVR